MSVTQYFDFQPKQPSNLGDIPIRTTRPVLERVAAHDNQVSPVSLWLEEVLFTGRVPLSTWTFVIAVADKLWVSDRTTLYFGKRTRLERHLYEDKMKIDANRLSLDIGISAYNSYGEILQTTQSVSLLNHVKLSEQGIMMRLEQDWTQLIFNFKLRNQAQTASVD